MKKIVLAILLALMGVVSVQAQDKPIAIDSRIKTFIYSENEVFRLVVHYGYQTSIEFADGEEIQTISVGNNYAWQLTPIGRRLFIKPLEENILTNMTILTNRRAYQFEIQSKLLSYTIDEELVYVVRFFYPEEDFDKHRPSVASFGQQDPVPVIKPYNFNYTLTGPDSIAPVKIFDDGINTFFRFSEDLQSVPSISVRKGEQFAPLQLRTRGDYIVVNTVANEFKVSSGRSVVNVFNENYKKGTR